MAIPGAIRTMLLVHPGIWGLISGGGSPQPIQSLSYRTGALRLGSCAYMNLVECMRNLKTGCIWESCVGSLPPPEPRVATHELMDRHDRSQVLKYYRSLRGALGSEPPGGRGGPTGGPWRPRGRWEPHLPPRRAEGRAPDAKRLPCFVDLCFSNGFWLTLIFYVKCYYS